MSQDPTPLRRRVLSALRASPGPLTTKQLADIVYRDREDGGPLWASTCIGVTIHRLRCEGLEIPLEGAPRDPLGYRLTAADRERLAGLVSCARRAAAHKELPREERDRRDAVIRAGAAAGDRITAIARRVGCAGSYVRDRMHRLGLYAAWDALRKRRAAS